MKSIRSFLIGIFITGSLAVGLHLLHAQEAATPVSGGTDSLTAIENEDVSGLSDMEVMIKALELIPSKPASELPSPAETHGFYSVQHPEWPLLPGDVLGLNFWPLQDGIFAIDDRTVNYSQPVKSKTTAKTAGGMMTMDDVDLNPGDGDTNDDGGGYSPMISLNNDYGTNLYIAQVSMASGYYSGIISNSIADVQYEIQYKTDLLQTNWQSADWFVFGSEVTNWTAFSVPAISSNNLFLRIRSWQSSDGSGLPDWWELEYFGHTGIDPYADPDGDGWNNLQEFINGTSPTAFNAPPAPQLTVSFNANGTATISWLPSPGPVTGYTVTKTDYQTGQTTNITFSSDTDSFTDDLSGDAPYDILGEGPTEYVNYQIQADYAGGDSAWSVVASPEQYYYVSVVNLIYGSQGSAYLTASPSTFPAGTAAVRLTRVDTYAEYFFGNSAFDTNWDIPVTAFTNGLYLIPASWASAPVDSYGQTDYAWWLQTVSNGKPNSEATRLIYGSNPSGTATWLAPPYFDGRAQLKQNLIFLLRSASENNPFQFTETTTNNFYNDGYNGVESDYYNYTFTNPASYAYAGLYRQQDQSFNPWEPFEENYRYRNFVFDSSLVSGNGALTTGVNNYFGLQLQDVMAYWFDPPATNWTTLPALLATNDTRWLYSEWEASGLYGDESDTTITNINPGGAPNFVMAGSARNFFGLPYLSAEFAYNGDAGLTMGTLSAGGSYSESDLPDNPQIYPEVAQPQFQTVEYDTWDASPLPGMTNFSPSQTSDLLIASVGGSIGVNAYAKLSVQNGYSGVYGYLEQYFDQAYQINTNGVVTTNSAGILSPYGNFFATQPGPAALVTMPDVDTGQRGTNIVYAIKLQLDANHDGSMDLSFGGPDNTASSSPFIFWANNNYDRWDDDGVFLTPEQDDILTNGVADCNYTDFSGNRIIPDTRDLEDFARLWVCGVTSNLLAALPSGSTVTLSWSDVGSPNPNNPTIDIFQAADADGGIGYLTNETSAANQIDPAQAAYVGRISPGQSIQLNANILGSTWRGDHFIWCGVSNGTGGLTLTIADASGNVLGQTTAYIQIQDIKNMYERWTVGDEPGVAPLTNAILATEGLSAGESAFEYTPPQGTNTPYILLVHGYNMATWEKDTYAQTAFKRLYWQGYQGRFGAFDWPTFDNPFQFDASESQAWQSAQGLLNKLNDLNAQYPGQVYLMAHSLGNVVAGEALRLAGSSQPVNTYIAVQGAVAAHAYDPTATTRSLGDYELDMPNCYADYWTSGAPSYFNGSAGAGTYVNFFNTNDWALATNVWQYDQDEKPDVLFGYYFDDPNLYYKNSTELFFPTNTYELFARVIQARSYALGAQPDVGGAFDGNEVNLSSVWPLDSGQYTAHIWHSAEFRSDNPQRWLFWDEVLVKMKLKSP